MRKVPQKTDSSTGSPSSLSMSVLETMSGVWTSHSGAAGNLEVKQVVPVDWKISQGIPLGNFPEILGNPGNQSKKNVAIPGIVFS